MQPDLNVPVHPIQPAAWPVLDFEPSDRVLVLAPHPDDESLVCGGVIQQALAMKLPVHVVFYTYGDNNEWSFIVYYRKARGQRQQEVLPWHISEMGEVRHGEALAATGRLGLSSGDVTFLGYPDFGTLQMWEAHWRDAPAFTSMFGRKNAVPYPDALRPGAPYKAEEILHDLTTVMRDFRPTRIFLSHPADHNPDHAALYLFTRVVLWNLAGELQPRIHPFLAHYPGWPEPRRFAPEMPIDPPARLAQRCEWELLRLTPEQIECKRSALQAHVTQYSYSHDYLDTFVRPNELFGDFPRAVLSSDRAVASIGPNATAPVAQAPDEMGEDGQARFIGVESRSVRRLDDHIELEIGLSRPMGHDMTASIYSFGYRPDCPFPEMPKLHVEIGRFRHKVYDGYEVLRDSGVEVVRQSRHLIVRVPFDAMRRPDRILGNVVTRLGKVPVHIDTWRIIELP